jgi:hypothetical protein
MLEERVGDGTEPSAYSGESGAVDGDQVLDATLSADKIAAGTIGAQTIIMDGSSSILKSSNFAAGSSGWQIKGDGSAEFANVTVRGTLNASDLTSGYINGLRFGSDSIGSGPVVSGALHAALGGNYEYSIAYNTGAFPVAGSTWIGPLTLPANTDRTKIMIVVSIMPMNSAAVSGRLVACIQRGSPNGAYLPYSNFNMAMPATMIHTLSFTYFDSTPGTGSLNYYTGIHQNITSGTAQNCRLNWMLLEISK